MESLTAVDLIYRRAAAETGKPEEELRRMAVTMFASMLLHACVEKPKVIWTAAVIEDGRLSVEVNIPRRRCITSD